MLTIIPIIINIGLYDIRSSQCFKINTNTNEEDTFQFDILLCLFLAIRTKEEHKIF